MAAAIGVRVDYTSLDLRRFSQRCNDPDQVRRLLALGLILDGGSRSEAAKAAGVTLQIIRDWVIRFNADGPDGLVSRRAPGKTSILNGEQRRALAEQVEAGPIPAAHGVVRGASSIWHSGCGTSSACRSPSRRLYQVALTTTHTAHPASPPGHHNLLVSLVAGWGGGVGGMSRGQRDLV